MTHSTSTMNKQSIIDNLPWHFIKNTNSPGGIIRDKQEKIVLIVASDVVATLVIEMSEQFLTSLKQVTQ